MLTKTRSMIGSVVFALAVGYAASAAAQVSTTANGPYYATPSWDQKLTASRFVILANWNNEAVLDRETGLVWERSPLTLKPMWFDALVGCYSRSIGGRKGWRMPGVQELASLVDPTVAGPGPTLPAGHPFLTAQPWVYWATTLDPSYPDQKAGVNFADGSVGFHSKNANNIYYVWCVRGGQGPDVQ